MRSIHASLILLLLSLLAFGCLQDDFLTDYRKPQAQYNGTIAQYLESRPDAFSTTVTALRRVRLLDTLRGGSFTLFAPSEAGWTSFYANNTRYKSLTNFTDRELREHMLQHLLPGKITGYDLTVDSKTFTTLRPNTVELRIANSTDVLVVVPLGGVVTTRDVQPTNGVVHVISRARPYP